ncbi:MAG: hypothetical protein MUE85_17130 [Microscillaceae bacterium]|jgi:hypothetical protein|nr:hypothetical protein [Microscillaceae bacterium]
MTKSEVINRDLVNITEKRMELGRLMYADQDYDVVEEELHQLEDDFVAHFGKYLEPVLQAIHTQYCPHTEVMSPIAYLAKNYIKTGKYENGSAIYDLADFRQGLIVDSERYEIAHLVIVPNPVRIILTAQAGEVCQEVWRLD